MIPQSHQGAPCQECGGYGHEPMLIGPAYTPEEGDAMHEEARRKHPCRACNGTGYVRPQSHQGAG